MMVQGLEQTKEALDIRLSWSGIEWNEVCRSYAENINNQIKNDY